MKVGLFQPSGIGSMLRLHSICFLLLVLLQTSTFCYGFHQSPVGHRASTHARPRCDESYRGCSILKAEEDNFRSEPTAGDGAAAGRNNGGNGIDVSIDERLYRVRLSRAPGIEWGTDLSFAFVYVREMDPTGQASLLGMVNRGDQLCELTPVPDDESIPRPDPINLLGASFDFVMTSFASLDKKVSEMDLVFFRGSKDELKTLCTGEAEKSDAEKTITITVIQNKGSAEEQLIRLRAPMGVNIRQHLVDNGINVYQSVTRWTNCKGKQLCGTCIVNIADGLPNTNWKSMDEASTLRSNPDSYRLSCVTFAHGDVTVETYPPVNADQWTR